MRVPRPKPITIAYLALYVACLLSAAQKGKDAQLTKLPAGQNVLWQDPGEVESRNLVWGAGGEANQPQPPFEFIKEQLSGTTPKVDVKDAKGTTWVVKF